MAEKKKGTQQVPPKDKESVPRSEQGMQETGNINADIVAAMVEYNPRDYLSLQDRDKWDDATRLHASINAERDEACGSAGLTPGMPDYDMAWSRVRADEYVEVITERSRLNMIALSVFMQRYGEYHAELITAFRECAIKDIVWMRDMLKRNLRPYKMTLADARDIACGRLVAEDAVCRLCETFSDDTLRALILEGSRCGHLVWALDYGPTVSAMGFLHVETLKVLDELLPDKWTVEAFDSARTPGTQCDTDIVVDSGYVPPHPFIYIPSPNQTLIMPNRVNGALTGIMERGDKYRVLANKRIVELDEGGKGNSHAVTVITAFCDNWQQLAPADSWPYGRIVSLIDTVRMRYGPDIFPLDVPVETGLHWCFGMEHNGNPDVLARRGEKLRGLLARLRPFVTIDLRALAEAGRIDVDALRRELGFAETDNAFLATEAPMLNTEWGVSARVNRNGEYGECFRIFSWPIQYVYSIATGYANRLPDALTELILTKKEMETKQVKRICEGEDMLTIKSYLLTHITMMYREKKVGRKIAMRPLYEFAGVAPYGGGKAAENGRRNVRVRCERYLDNWTEPRIVYDPVKRIALISAWKWSPKKDYIEITLTRGLKKMLGW